MPRIRPLAGTAGDSVGGFRAPGLYAELLKHERDRTDHFDPRWRWYSVAGMQGEDPPPKYRRSRKLLDALEARKTVVVPLRWAKKYRLPWRRPEVTTVTVTFDDLVRPTELPCAPPGNAADDDLSVGSCIAASEEG